MQGFETSRLLARLVEADDVTLFRDLYCDADTMLHVCRPFSPGQAAGLLLDVVERNTRERPGLVFLALVEKSTGSSIGLCGLAHIDRQTGGAEAGILLKSAWRGSGYASEAIVGLLKRCFGALPVKEIRLEYRREHRAMQRVADASGFPPEEADDGAARVASKCVRTAIRGAWRPPGSDAEQPGEDHVERDPHIGNDGPGCQPAPCER